MRENRFIFDQSQHAGLSAAGIWPSRRHAERIWSSLIESCALYRVVDRSSPNPPQWGSRAGSNPLQSAPQWFPRRFSPLAAPRRRRSLSLPKIVIQHHLR